MKKLLTLVLALVMLASAASALAYDGEILTLTADSDSDPFVWDASTDKMAAFIEDNFGIQLIQS